MPGIPKAKLELLKKAFIEEAMSPGDAAKKAGVTYATANRYYEKWGDEIKAAREQQLIPQIEESLKKFLKPSARGKRSKS
jgi:hypothetical protein